MFFSRSSGHPYFVLHSRIKSINYKLIFFKIVSCNHCVLYLFGIINWNAPDLTKKQKQLESVRGDGGVFMGLILELTKLYLLAVFRRIVHRVIDFCESSNFAKIVRWFEGPKQRERKSTRMHN